MEATNSLSRAIKLADLVSDFLLIASPTVDIEFFSRFLNSDTAARVAYDGQRLAPNGYTKFYVILHALQHITDIQRQRGPLFAMLTMSASRHKLYSIPLTDSKRLHRKLLRALLWTLRSAFLDEWSDEYDELVEWGWTIIARIYLGADKCHEESINHRLCLSRRKSATFHVSDTQSGINPFFSAIGTTKRQQHRSFMSQFNPKKATNINDLAIFDFESRSSLSFINPSAENVIYASDQETKPKVQIKANIQKKEDSKSKSHTPPTAKQSHSQFDCMNTFYRADVPISVYILTTMLRVFVRSTQLFDQLSDILLIVNIWSKLSDTESSADLQEETLDEVLIRAVMIMPLLPYLALLPLLYRAVFHRLRRSGNTSFQHHPYLCRLTYIVVAIPVFVVLDLYVYSVKLLSNLSETKYLYQYWGTRSIIEIFAESIPQSILLLILFVRSRTNENAVIESIPLGLMIFGFVCSFVNTLVRLGELRYAAAAHHKRPWKYVSEHLFQFRVLPWSDGLQLNQITSLHISNDLSLPEWIEFLQYLRVNTSLQSIRCDGYLGIALSLSLLRTLRNNHLTVIDLGNAQLFANVPIKLVDGDTQKYIDAILPADSHDTVPEGISMNFDAEHRIDAISNDNGLRRVAASSMFDESADSEQSDSSVGRQTIASIMINEEDDSEEVDRFKITCDEVAIELQRILDRNENLRYLSLSNNQIGDRCHLLFGSIVNATNLRFLDLSNNNLSRSTCGDALGRHLANIVIYCPRMHTLRLDDNGLRDEEVYVLLDGFAERRTRIEMALSLTNNMLTSSALKALKECSGRKKQTMTFSFDPQRKSDIAT